MAANPPTFQFENTDGFSVVTLHPSLNEAQWASIERIGSEILSRLTGTPAPALVIDLSSLSYMGSAMVALVVRLWKAVNEKGGRMAVVNKNEMVLEVLRLAGLANVWTIVPDREAAVDALGGPNYKPSDGGSRGGLAAGAGLLAAIAAITLVVLPLAGVKLEPSEPYRLAGLGTAALGLILGTLGAALGGGFIRVLGVLAIVLALSAGGIAAVRVPPAEANKPFSGPTPSPPPATTPPPSTTPVPGVPETKSKEEIGNPPEVPGSTPNPPSVTPPEGAGNAVPPEAGGKENK